MHGNLKLNTCDYLDTSLWTPLSSKNITLFRGDDETLFIDSGIYTDKNPHLLPLKTDRYARKTIDDTLLAFLSTFESLQL